MTNETSDNDTLANDTDTIDGEQNHTKKLNVQSFTKNYCYEQKSRSRIFSYLKISDFDIENNSLVKIEVEKDTEKIIYETTIKKLEETTLEEIIKDL